MWFSWMHVNNFTSCFSRKGSRVLALNYINTINSSRLLYGASNPYAIILYPRVKRSVSTENVSAWGRENGSAWAKILRSLVISDTQALRGYFHPVAIFCDFPHPLHIITFSSFISLYYVRSALLLFFFQRFVTKTFSPSLSRKRKKRRKTFQ